jgi:hypothetical protein
MVNWKQFLEEKISFFVIHFKISNIFLKSFLQFLSIKKLVRWIYYTHFVVSTKRRPSTVGVWVLQFKNMKTLGAVARNGTDISQIYDWLILFRLNSKDISCNEIFLLGRCVLECGSTVQNKSSHVELLSVNIVRRDNVVKTVHQ